MEDIHRLSEPTPKDALRIILALAVHSIKPIDVPLNDYLAQLRIDVYARRYARSLSDESRDMGGYGQLDPLRDLMAAVSRMMHMQRRGEVSPAQAESEDEEL